MDPALTDPASWAPFLATLRNGRSPGAGLEFGGQLSASSFGGSWLIRHRDGTTAPDGGSEEGMDALEDLSDLTGPDSFGVSARVGHDGTESVTLTVLSEAVTAGHSSLIGSVQLVPGALPAPYCRVPQPTSATTAPTADPDLVRQIVRAALPEAVGLAPQAVDAWQQRTGLTLPPEIRALFETANSGDLIVPEAGTPSRRSDDERYVMRISPLDTPDPYFTPAGRFGGDWRFGATEVAPADPTGRLQPLAFSPAWVLLGDDWGGNLFVADLAPGPGGTVGQILFLDHESSASVDWVAESLTDWLVDPEGSTDHPAPVTESAASNVKVRIQSAGTGLEAVTVDTEVVTVHAVDIPLDLRPLSGHRNLRTLTVIGGPVTGIEVVASMPRLEFLSVDVDTWSYLERNNFVPSSLLAVGFDSVLKSDPRDEEAIEVANRLLRRWGREPINVIRVC